MLLELRERLAQLDKLSGPFSCRGALELSDSHPRLYLGLVVMMAVSGYLFLLLFPALLLFATFSLFSSFGSLASANHWFSIGILVLLLLLGGVVTYAVFALRFSPPSGLQLSAKNCPKLFQLLHELDEIYMGPRIERVVLRDRFDLRIVKTPRNGFPFSTSHTLIIGLPVLQAMSPLDLHVLLARRLGQLAGRHSRLGSWLYFLSDMWAQYLVNCERQRSPLLEPVCFFFRLYVPRYAAFATAVIRGSELEADRYALEAVNDRDTARAITGQALSDAYLKHVYWPEVLERVRQSDSPRRLPHAGMAEVFEGGLSKDELNAALQQVEQGEHDCTSPMPSLSERLDNIGHVKPLLPKAVAMTAARFYLGSACDNCIDVMDKRWLKKSGIRH